MTDDFAAIASGMLAGLLLLCVIEFYAVVKKGVQRVELAKTQATKLRDGPKEPGPWVGIEESGLGHAIRNLMWTVAAGAALCALMAGDLVLVALWAAVDGHGPARWLAWGTVAAISAGLGGILTYIFFKMYGSFWTISGSIADIERIEGQIRTGERFRAWLRDPEHAPHHPAFDVMKAMMDRDPDGPS
ncbi:hypothetical protein AB0L71_06255 [Streptomyces sp. NPDC052052]|uniref:hypothetical protein n=1 Tax=Streptomyces sp. NPDC052052 TaxID=3154756 RepID=UPI0034497C2B